MDILPHELSYKGLDPAPEQLLWLEGTQSNPLPLEQFLQ